MLYSYNDIFEKLGNDYQILKAIKNEEIFKLASGVYSDDKNVSELQVIALNIQMQFLQWIVRFTI